MTRDCLGSSGQVDPADVLRQIAFQLERADAPSYRVRAFRRAAQVTGDLPVTELSQRIGDGTLQALPGIGPVTAAIIAQAADGQQPAYLTRLLDEAPPAPRTGLRAALRGDCHTHSDWSDGGSPPAEMARTARDLGHEWVALTDHSPRLSVAHGLSAERLAEQLALVRRLNESLAPFRILTGIEVDILEDGGLDQREDLLAQLDVVVASVHSQLRMPAGPMTARMLAAVRSPHVDVLGHCTGRLLTRRARPESAFDPVAVFSACLDSGVAVEINCRPERQDPPDRLLRLAAETGCVFAIDTDAHAPGQLAWLDSGCTRAASAGIPAERVINTRHADEIAAGARRLPARAPKPVTSVCKRSGHKAGPWRVCTHGRRSRRTVRALAVPVCILPAGPRAAGPGGRRGGRARRPPGRLG
jgi:putative hydrolase